MREQHTVVPCQPAANNRPRASSTESLTPSVYQHRDLWGRTYHSFRANDIQYWGPNDDRHNEGLDLRHQMLKSLLGNRLFVAPLDTSSVRYVLDVGCGTGRWAIEFADAHEHAEVNGIDLSPIQPSSIPPNCHFILDNIEDPWTEPDDHFSFVHIRCLMGAIKDWPALYRQAFRKTQPGGYIEHLEMSMKFKSDDVLLSEDHLLTKWSQTIIDSGERIGKTFVVADRAKEWITSAGFEDVEARWYKLPVGAWPKDEVRCCRRTCSVRIH